MFLQLAKPVEVVGHDDKGQAVGLAIFFSSDQLLCD